MPQTTDMTAFWAPLRFTVLTAVAVLMPLMTADGGARQQQPPRFRSGVDIVVIDVSVVDRKGMPVDDLGPGDFTVVVDGVARRIVSAQFINHHGTPVPPAGPEARTDLDSATPAERARAAPIRGRDVLVVVDEDSLETGDGLLAKRAASGFLDKLGPADRVGFTTVPRLRSTMTLSADRAQTSRAIANWVPGPATDPPGRFWIGVAEAFEIERGDPVTIQKVADRECSTNQRGSANPQCTREVVQEGRQLASRAHMRGTQSLDALRTLGRGLRQIDGPKTILLISGGILTPESTSSFSELERELAAAQVMLYTLYFEKSPYSAARVRNSPSLQDDDRIEADGLANATAAAGGTLLTVIGTVEPYFERVATELSASYLLAIEVTPADRNGRPHRVDVKVSRTELVVRSRKQYVIPPEKPPA
jgi:VWFA-related protein